MNILIDQEHCTGCGACSGICPVQAISMQQSDEDGFYRPFIDESLCIKCGKCESVCPQLHEKTDRQEYYQRVYAANNKNEEARNAGASGGLFAAMASEIIKRGGCVAGVIYDKELRVVHQLVENMEELQLLYGSKYAQSDMRLIYDEVYQKLAEGREVLFCGTPCQVAGIKSYIRNKKLEDKLITVDLLCRGVPSPKSLQKYLEMTENQFEKKIVSIKFKDNEKGWHNVNTRIVMEDGSELYLPIGECTYVGGFLDENMTVRDSCFHCHYKTTERTGDITIGDFWGLKNTALIDDKGTSVVIVNSEKGKALWDAVKQPLSYKESTMWRVVRGNRMAFTKLPENPVRKQFWKYLYRYDFDEALDMANNDLNKYKEEILKVHYDY